MITADVHTLFEKHERVALLFSGGKDSLACLYLLRPFWQKLQVLWVNTQATLPEQRAQMADIATKVPNFTEVISDQPTNIATFGLPTDIVPVRQTVMGSHFTQTPLKVKLQSSLECCLLNIWQPAFMAVRACGATMIVTGQRNTDKRRSPIKHGETCEGMQYCYPLQDWSTQRVFDFLKSIDSLFQYWKH